MLTRHHRHAITTRSVTLDAQQQWQQTTQKSPFPTHPRSPGHEKRHCAQPTHQTSSCELATGEVLASCAPYSSSVIVLFAMAGFLSSPGRGFFGKLATRAEKIDSLLCVGLDPHVAELGEEKTAAGAKAFCLRLIEATSSVALAYKPNSAFFEVFGVSSPALLVSSASSAAYACLSAADAQFCFGVAALSLFFLFLDVTCHNIYVMTRFSTCLRLSRDLRLPFTHKRLFGVAGGAPSSTSASWYCVATQWEQRTRSTDYPCLALVLVLVATGQRKPPFPKEGHVPPSYYYCWTASY